MSNEQMSSLSNSEWRIMECLWAKAPRTLMEIVKCVKAETGWAKSTITTMVTRMEAKGVLFFKEGEKAKAYYPAFNRDEAAIKETESLLTRIYRGSVGMMLNTLVEKKPLTKGEIDELYAILQKAEEETT